ncbi:MAG: hypothetical protein R8N24_02870 [Alphaproteobacteria bacterium]|nr:hypothetical protein [Alphaproteobacteria bacterium]
MPGEFLPANTFGCRICPTDYTCLGGTFAFKEQHNQGLSIAKLFLHDLTDVCAENAPHYFKAIFKPNTHTCLPGYYLPANIDECQACKNNNYCIGGTYSFNEKLTQGIYPCPDEHPYAPIGMWQESQCGRKLHIGSDTLYVHQQPANPTQRRLFIRFDNTNYSANIVMRDTNSTYVPKMSFGAKYGLHLLIKDIVNGQELLREYLVHDDSVK